MENNNSDRCIAIAFEDYEIAKKTLLSRLRKTIDYTYFRRDLFVYNRKKERHVQVLFIYFKRPLSKADKCIIFDMYRDLIL